MLDRTSRKGRIPASASPMKKRSMKSATGSGLSETAHPPAITRGPPSSRSLEKTDRPDSSSMEGMFT